MPTLQPNTQNELHPQFDLRLERQSKLSAQTIWQAWTQPELIVQWFTPAPWQTTSAHIELRAGGAFLTTFKSPEGDLINNNGCVLEAIPNQRLVWTNMMTQGFRPNPEMDQSAPGRFAFTAMIELQNNQDGCLYRATVIHGTQEACQQHADMGFEAGWGAVFTQLENLMQS